MTRPVTKAIFPVVGMGAQFLPATKVMLKEVVPLIDKPLRRWALATRSAAHAG